MAWHVDLAGSLNRHSTLRAVESYIMLLMLPCYPEAATANFPEALETQRWVMRTNHATAILGND